MTGPDRPALRPSVRLDGFRQPHDTNHMRSHAEAPPRETRLSETALSALAQRHKHPIRVHTT